jgi:ribosomal protein S18 acetylase RimI-like enzyme
MQMHALRPSGAAPVAVPGLEVRPGSVDDLETGAVPLAAAVWEHQALAPAFTGLTPPPEDEARRDWREALEEDGAAYFVAELAGRPAGHALVYPADDQFGMPAGALHLAAAAPLPGARGEAVGLALTHHVLAWAGQAGFVVVDTDWRVPNLLASRFWPARGFRPTFVRLSRVVCIG